VRSLGGTVIKDSLGQPGFPGYDGMTATNGLAYTLDMQLHGVPVTDTYLSDVHDSSTAGTPFGPASPATSSSCTSTTPRSESSSARWPRTASPGPTRCS